MEVFQPVIDILMQKNTSTEPIQGNATLRNKTKEENTAKEREDKSILLDKLMPKFVMLGSESEAQTVPIYENSNVTGFTVINLSLNQA